MRLQSSVAALAVLALASPALAAGQTAPASPAPAQAQAQAPAAPTSPEEAALEAKAEAFEAQLEQMNTELEAVLGDAAKDAAAKTAAADAVIDRYAPAMTAFADDVEAFLKAESEKPENAERKAELVAASSAAAQSIRALPDQFRTGVRQAASASAQPAPTPQ